MLAFGLLAALALAQDAGSSIELEDVTDALGLGGKAGDRYACGDVDEDGDPDVLVDGHLLLRNDSKPGAIALADVTKGSGLESAGATGATFADLDRDGHLDLVNNAAQLFKGDGKGHFAPFADLKLAFPPGTAAIGVGDIDGDGFLDVVSSGGEPEFGKPYAKRSAWLDPKGKGFVDKTAELGLGQERYGRSVIFCDYDEDGDADLYIGNYRLTANDLYRNDGGKLVDVSAAAGVTGRNDPEMFDDAVTHDKKGFQYGHTIAASWVDLNDDGLFDLWVSNLAHRYVGPVAPEDVAKMGGDYDDRGYRCDDSNLFVSNGPPAWTFADQREDRGIPRRPIGGQGVFNGDELWSNSACGDLDCNGFVDVYCNQVYGDLDYSYGVLYANDGESFEEVHRLSGVTLYGGYGSAMVDLDSDGKLDLLASGTDKPSSDPVTVHVFHNRSADKPWIGIRLERTDKAQDVGARVLLVQEKGVQVAQVAATFGSHTQEADPRAHFGLGELGAVLDVVVYWPDGRVQSTGPLKPGEYHLVKRPAAKAPDLRIVAKKSAAVGEEVVFQVFGAPGGARFDWDCAGGPAAEHSGKEPKWSHAFESAGVHRLRVRAAGKPGPASEAHADVEVKAGP